MQVRARRQTDKQTRTYTPTDRQIEVTDRDRPRETDRRTSRQRQTERQTGRDRDRQWHTVTDSDKQAGGHYVTLRNAT